MNSCRVCTSSSRLKEGIYIATSLIRTTSENLHPYTTTIHTRTDNYYRQLASKPQDWLGWTTLVESGQALRDTQMLQQLFKAHVLGQSTHAAKTFTVDGIGIAQHTFAAVTRHLGTLLAIIAVG